MRRVEARGGDGGFPLVVGIVAFLSGFVVVNAVAGEICGAGVDAALEACLPVDPEVLGAVAFAAVHEEDFGAEGGGVDLPVRAGALGGALYHIVLLDRGLGGVDTDGEVVVLAGIGLVGEGGGGEEGAGGVWEEEVCGLASRGGSAELDAGGEGGSRGGGDGGGPVVVEALNQEEAPVRGDEVLVVVLGTATLAGGGRGGAIGGVGGGVGATAAGGGLSAGHCLSLLASPGGSLTARWVDKTSSCTRLLNTQGRSSKSTRRVGRTPSCTRRRSSLSSLCRLLPKW